MRRTERSKERSKAENESELVTSIARPLFSGTTAWGGRPMVGPTRRRDRQIVGETCGRLKDRESKRNPFELVPKEDITDADTSSIQDYVEQLIKKMCRVKMTAAVVKEGEQFSIHISANIEKKISGVTLRPLRSKKESELMPSMTFPSLEILQLSEFYVVSATMEDCTLERVIMIPTSGIPEGRDSEIIRNVIKSKNQFIEYVRWWTNPSSTKHKLIK